MGWVEGVRGGQPETESDRDNYGRQFDLPRLLCDVITSQCRGGRKCFIADDVHYWGGPASGNYDVTHKVDEENKTFFSHASEHCGE